MNNLAFLLQQEKKLDEAEPLFRETLRIWQRTLPPDHPDIATCMINLDELLDEQGKFADAEQLHRARWRSAASHCRPNIRCWHRVSTLANVLWDEGKLAPRPSAPEREALAIRRKVAAFGSFRSGGQHQQDRHAASGAGEAERRRKPFFREALDVRRKTLPPGHADIFNSLAKLAKPAARAKKFAEAEPLYREALPGLQKSYGEASWQAGNCQLGLGRTLADCIGMPKQKEC